MQFKVKLAKYRDKVCQILDPPLRRGKHLTAQFTEPRAFKPLVQGRGGIQAYTVKVTAPFMGIFSIPQE